MTIRPATIAILAGLLVVAVACTGRAGSHGFQSSPAVTAGGPGAAGGSGSHGPRGLAAGSTAVTSTLLLGHLIIHAPGTWRVTYADARGDFTVSAGACTVESLTGSMNSSTCPSFSVIARAGTAAAAIPGARAYRSGRSFRPSAGPLGCPGLAGTGWEWLQPPGAARHGQVSIGGHMAYYSRWRIECRYFGAAAPVQISGYFTQLDWYLPRQRILVVTVHPISGLATLLARARWR